MLNVYVFGWTCCRDILDSRDDRERASRCVVLLATVLSLGDKMPVHYFGKSFFCPWPSCFIILLWLKLSERFTPIVLFVLMIGSRTNYSAISRLHPEQRFGRPFARRGPDDRGTSNPLFYSLAWTQLAVPERWLEPRPVSVEVSHSCSCLDREAASLLQPWR
jgi:hypothetical protein